MHITDINKTKRGRFSIFVDDEFYGVLHMDVYARFNYSVGSDIEQEDLDEYIYNSQIIIAKERALGLLSARSYTAKGLKDKLLRDVDSAAADEIVVRMEELGLIDDHDYAMRYASDCIKLRGYSHSHTAMALREKGISRDVIDYTISKLGEEDSEFLIAKRVLKKYRRRLGDEDNERRTINALIRRGFRYNDIRNVLDNLNEDIHYYDDYDADYESIL